MLTPRLKNPPIVEVVCGFFFAPTAALNPLVVGKYWGSKPDYSAAEINPPVSDINALSFGIGPLRSRLVSKNGEWIIQVQPDRLYFNWRKQESEYPHFHDYDGKPGVMSRALDETKSFAIFCEAELGSVPPLTHVELTKIDLIAQERHFRDFDDLTKVIPMLASLRGGITTSAEPVVQIAAFETRGPYAVRIQLTNAVIAPPYKAALQIEATVRTQASSDLPKSFEAMNVVLNEAFFSLLNKNELNRFGGVV